MELIFKLKDYIKVIIIVTVILLLPMIQYACEYSVFDAFCVYGIFIVMVVLIMFVLDLVLSW